MTIPYNESERATSENKKWKRDEIAKLLQDFESREPSVSQRDFAKKMVLPVQHCGIGQIEKIVLMQIQF